MSRYSPLLITAGCLRAKTRMALKSRDPPGEGHHLIFQGAWHLRSLEEDHALQPVGERVSAG
eukprot:5384620-Alexandrium_andersonii.AAC.1